MTWEVINATSAAASRGVPSARVGRGPIILNGASSRLLGPMADREFVELMLDRQEQ